MKLLLATVGTTGDVLPYFAIARELQRRGHRATVVSFANWERAAAAWDVPFEAVGSAMSLAEFDAASSLIRQLPRVGQHVGLLEFLTREARPRFARARALAREFDAAVCHTTDFVAQRALSAARIPLASGALSPLSFLLPPQSTPELLRVCRRARNLSDDVRAWLDRIEADPIESRLAALDGERLAVNAAGQLSRELNLVFSSSAFIQQGSASDRAVVATGYVRPNWPPVAPSSESLRAFLGGERADVAVAFGSTLGIDAASWRRAIVHAADVLGVRVVVQSGWAAFAPFDHENIHVVGPMPHAELFRAGRVAVHHAGPGTLHAAVDAGAVSIAAPQWLDQEYWARAVTRLRIGRALPEGAGVDADAFVAAVRDVMSDPVVASRTETVAETLRAEDGATVAVDRIERWLAERA